MLNNRKGQSTIEYVLLVTAVVAVMILFTTGRNTDGLKGKVFNTYNSVGNNVGTKTGQLTLSQDSERGTVPSPGEQGFNLRTTMPAETVK